MDDRTLSRGSDGKLQILRESEFFGGCIRVKISVKNISNLALLDVALELESDEQILHFDRCEPEYPEKNGKLQLGNIHPNTDQTVAFYLDPLICAKEGTDINCRVSFKDASGRPDSVQMETLKIKVVCPIFRTEQEINIGRLKELIAELRFNDNKVYLFPKRVELHEILKSCRDVIQLHDVRHIKTFKTTDEKTFESWYYGKTKVTKKDLVIKCAIRKETESIEVLASGNDSSDITGLLAELGRNLTKEFEKIGEIQPVFNITIKDSVIQRSNLLSFCDLDGSCGGNVVIEDSLVQRSNIASLNSGKKVHRGKKEEDKITQDRVGGARNSRNKIFSVVLFIGLLVLGYWMLAPGGSDTSQPLQTIPSPSQTIITFDRFPNGTPITADVILKGDEFIERGIIVAGAPESPYYCANATAAAILVDKGRGISFLSTALPNNITMCNGIPVAITFLNPVRQVTLTFIGANVTYIMKAFDESENFLGTEQKDGDLINVSYITFKSTIANIGRVNFGSQAAGTLVKEIQYELPMDNEYVAPD